MANNDSIPTGRAGKPAPTKHCPFCGDHDIENHRISGITLDDNTGYIHQAICTRCGAMGPPHFSTKKHDGGWIELWNKRRQPIQTT